MKNASLEWMKELGSPDYAEAKSAYRLFSRPWSISRDGMTWSVVTDGRSFAATPLESDFESVPEDVEKKLAPVFDSVLAVPCEESVSLTDLKKWCSGLERYGICETCHGEGQYECPTCGNDDADCLDCGGDGRSYLGVEAGTVLGIRIDMRRLWQLVKHFPDGEAKFGFKQGISVLRANGFVLALAELNGDEPAKAFPEPAHA